MHGFAQSLLNGTVSGLQMSLLALGLTLVYLPTRVLHIALAGCFAATPYLYVELTRQGAPLWLSALLTVIGMSAISAGIGAANHSRLFRRRSSPDLHLISSLGIFFVIEQLLVLTWGSESRFLRTELVPTGMVFGLRLALPQIIAALLSLAILLLFALWVRTSGLGLRLRAMSDNATEFSLAGFDVPRMRLVLFASAGALAAVSALLLANDVGFEPATGLNALLVAVVAVIVGGRSSFAGPIVGSIVLGVARAISSWFLSARWEDGVSFLLLALFLLLRPQGIIGVRGRLEAE